MWITRGHVAWMGETVLEGLKGRDHMRKYVKIGSIFPVALISQDRIMVMNVLDFIISDEFLGQLLEMSTPLMEEGCHQKMHNILLSV
ncbi:hypothetical protein B7P43_G05437 [Cryptotermes secundus]|uniref:Uncharacterized protein n=1 Tax=Cryptotermes secundus TaxID=105785 RepID=A0A2J7RP21_9NEOP|nr:hypothetical protein B7P43_G05437 [Cryptotermes secundus]